MTTTDSSTLTRQLQEVLDRTSAAWADGDAAAFAAAYTEDATATLPGFRLVGRGVIGSSMALAFDGPLRGTRRVHEVQEVRPLGADAAVATTTSATLAPGETEAPAERREWATWVLVREGSLAAGPDADERSGAAGWRIKAYHGSPVQP